MATPEPFECVKCGEPLIGLVYMPEGRCGRCLRCLGAADAKLIAQALMKLAVAQLLYLQS